jgi:hypothetical protein
MNELRLYLKRLEHVCVRLHSDKEVADDHRRAEVSTVMERLLAYTLKTSIASVCRLATSFVLGSHRTPQAEEPVSSWPGQPRKCDAHSRYTSGEVRSNASE